MTARPLNALLPHAAPASPDLRLILYGIRRMAAGGIADAHAANAFFTSFGMHYRRPLVLLRALVNEMSRTASARLTIGPCCCPRMSASEQAILDGITRATTAPEAAHEGLAALLHVRSCGAVLCGAQAVAGCFADLGRPLPLELHDCA